MRSSCAVRCRPCRSTRATAATHNALEMCSPRLRLSRHSAKRRLTCSRLSPCSPACADFVAIFIICSIHAIDMGDDDSKQINKNHAALPEGHPRRDGTHRGKELPHEGSDRQFEGLTSPHYWPCRRRRHGLPCAWETTPASMPIGGSYTHRSILRYPSVAHSDTPSWRRTSPKFLGKARQTAKLPLALSCCRIRGTFAPPRTCRSGAAIQPDDTRVVAILWGVLSDSNARAF